MKNQNPITKLLISTFWIVVFNFAFLAFSLETARAESSNIRLSPTLIKITAEPPFEKELPILIENLGDDTVNLNIEIKPFEAGREEKGDIKYLIEDPNPSFKRNIRLLDADFVANKITLSPKENKTLNLKIVVPDNQESIDYYFSIILLSQNDPVFEPVDEDELKTAYSINQIGLATNVLLSVGPFTTPSVEIEEFKTTNNFESGPIPFTLRVTNRGINMIYPKGFIFVKNMFGQTIAKIPVRPENILADSTRRLTDQPQTDSILWNERILFGIYTAEVRLDITETQTISALTKFSVMPVKPTGIALLSLIVVIFIYKRVRKKMENG